jgi:hypothetical protein
MGEKWLHLHNFWLVQVIEIRHWLSWAEGDKNIKLLFQIKLRSILILLLLEFGLVFDHFTLEGTYIKNIDSTILKLFFIE